ncbi:MAG: hypothetical protein K0V04_18890 [Deltaproteobacteria bacterium]|nr:hypothetical protein [Deltaproteobacteria bacterium]
MPDPYIVASPGELIRAADWNTLQDQIRTEIHGHAHSGGEDGVQLTADAIADGSVGLVKLDGAVQDALSNAGAVPGPSQAEFDDLIGQVEALTAAVATRASVAEVADVQAQVTSLQQMLTTLQDQVVVLQGQVQTLQGEVNVLQGFHEGGGGTGPTLPTGPIEGPIDEPSLPDIPPMPDPGDGGGEVDPLPGPAEEPVLPQA